MAFPQIDIPSAGPLTAADLDRSNTGRIYQLRRVELMPHGCDYQGECETRTWGRSEQPMAAEAATAEGADDWPEWLMTPRTTVVLLLTTGVPLLAVIGWAVVTWLG